MIVTHKRIYRPGPWGSTMNYLQIVPCEAPIQRCVRRGERRQKTHEIRSLSGSRSNHASTESGSEDMRALRSSAKNAALSALKR